MPDEFSAQVDHASGVVRLRCEPCDKTEVVRLDDAGFTDLVGDFAAEHRTCAEPSEDAPVLAPATTFAPQPAQTASA